MRYDITTITHAFGTAAKIVAGIDAYAKAPAHRGTLLGCWTTDIADLNQIILFRSFPDDAAVQADRQALLGTTDPFGQGQAIVRLGFETYVPFPWAAPVTPGTYGSVYEIRTYRLKHGGLPHVIAAWEAAMPGRGRISPLSAVMYALDGEARFTHIWPYAGTDDRAAKRARAVAEGVWPPKGGPDWLTGDMRSIIALPTAISPLA